MSSRKCFAYCNGCSDFVPHNNTFYGDWRGKKNEKCSSFCGSCKNVVDHGKKNDNKYQQYYDKKNENDHQQYYDKKSYDWQENDDDKKCQDWNDNDEECDYKYTKCFVRCEKRCPPPKHYAPKPCLPCPPKPCPPCPQYQPCPPCPPCPPRPCPPKPCLPCPKQSCTLADTLISVRDPTSDVYANSPPNVDLTGWTDLIIDAKDSFENESGTYTVRCSGDYEISLVVNYRTAFPILLDVVPPDGARIGEPDNNPLTRVPRVELYDVFTDKPLIASQFPVVHIIAFCQSPITSEPPCEIEVRALLEAGQVIINTVVPLVCGQRIRFRVVQNGIEFPVILPIPISTPVIDLSPPANTTTLSIKKLRDAPIVTIVTDHC